VTNVADLVHAPTRSKPQSVALIDGERELTWSDLSSAVDHLAGAFASLGVFARHRVSIALPNSVEFVVAYLAVLRSGMVAVPLNPGFTSDEYARVLADCAPRVVLAGPSSLDAVRQAVAAVHPSTAAPPLTVVVGAEADPARAERSFAELTALPVTPVLTPLDAEALAVLLYTDGTTRRPRAAMLSHRALLANVEQSARIEPRPVRPNDVVLGLVPMFHAYGLNAVLGQTLYSGATLVLVGSFDPDQTLHLIADRHVNCVPVTPPAVVAWAGRTDLSERLAGVRTLLSGAGPLEASVVERFEANAGVAVEQGYGLTEASPVVTSTIGSTVHKPGSVGRAVPGAEVRVVEARAGGGPSSDPGEILVRGDNLFSGYWPDGDGGPDGDGWLATGDVGYLDPDGDLFVVDRLTELVTVSGFNVYPTEVEDVISEVAGVREVAVIGRPAGDGTQQVVAFVVPSDPAANPDELVARIDAHVSARLARFKHPARIQITDALPRSATGKVAKGRLRAAQPGPAMRLR
jgi:long-chain acyl-CoA synthetase